MKLKLSPLKFAGILAGLFAIGIIGGFAYQWSHGPILYTPFVVTAANNPASSETTEPNVDVLAQTSPPASAIASAQPTPVSMSNLLSKTQPTPGPFHQGSNVIVLNSVRPATPPPVPSENELTLPETQRKEPTDRLPALGDDGQTIWVPRAIEGCWQGTGDSHLEYLGGCPNMFSGHTSPVQLRWCFRRIGNQPLTLSMAKGQYGGRVKQRWVVTGASGQSIQLRETISYDTMMFLHVVDTGNWDCRITENDQLACDEHELARCGPGPWMEGPWFSGNGWVKARHLSGENAGATPHPGLNARHRAELE
jgi:hypothetical protein